MSKVHIPVVLDAVVDDVKVGEVDTQLILDFDLGTACALDAEDCEACQ